MVFCACEFSRKKKGRSGKQPRRSGAPDDDTAQQPRPLEAASQVPENSNTRVTNGRVRVRAGAHVAPVRQDQGRERNLIPRSPRWDFDFPACAPPGVGQAGRQAGHRLLVGVGRVVVVAAVAGQAITRRVSPILYACRWIPSAARGTRYGRRHRLADRRWRSSPPATTARQPAHGSAHTARLRPPPPHGAGVWHIPAAARRVEEGGSRELHAALFVSLDGSIHPVIRFATTPVTHWTWMEVFENESTLWIHRP
jgi:hypothetical protein